MTRTHMTHDLAIQAADQIAAGTTVAELAKNWGMSRGTIYNGLRRYELPLRSNRTDWQEHLELQRLSGVPPELYAHRAGVAFASLRRAAWEAKQPLVVNTYAERSAFWAKLLDSFDPRHARTFCVMHDLPVTMVAHWFHKLNNPTHLLLWGFSQLLTVQGDQFTDVSRFHDRAANEFVLGKGKTCAHLNVRVANEVFRHASPLVLVGDA